MRRLVLALFVLLVCPVWAQDIQLQLEITHVDGGKMRFRGGAEASGLPTSPYSKFDTTIHVTVQGLMAGGDWGILPTGWNLAAGTDTRDGKTLTREEVSGINRKNLRQWSAGIARHQASGRVEFDEEVQIPEDIVSYRVVATLHHVNVGGSWPALNAKHDIFGPKPPLQGGKYNAGNLGDPAPAPTPSGPPKASPTPTAPTPSPTPPPEFTWSEQGPNTVEEHGLDEPPEFTSMTAGSSTAPEEAPPDLRTEFQKLVDSGVSAKDAWKQVLKGKVSQADWESFFVGGVGQALGVVEYGMSNITSAAEWTLYGAAYYGEGMTGVQFSIPVDGLFAYVNARRDHYNNTGDTSLFYDGAWKQTGHKFGEAQLTKKMPDAPPVFVDLFNALKVPNHKQYLGKVNKVNYGKTNQSEFPDNVKYIPAGSGHALPMKPLAQ